jgi:MoaA/NifB/PqqE/SkfB family radical SAM enzyme
VSAKTAVKRALRPAYLRMAAGRRIVRIKHGPTPSPRYLTLDPTYRCNLRCISCKCPQIAASYPPERELTVTQHDELFAQFKALGGSQVDIYGGEPLLVKSLPETIRSAKTHGLHASLTTNGLLLSEEKLRRLGEAGLDRLTISLDGTGTTYDRITGRARFEDVRVALQTFARVNSGAGSRPIDAQVHMTVMSQNVQNLSEVLEFAHEVSISEVSFQYVSRVDTEVNKKTEELLGGGFLPAANHWDIDKSVLMDKTQVTSLVKQVEKLKSMARRLEMTISVDPVLDGRLSEGSLVEGRFELDLPCTVPWDGIFVGPLGDLSPCPMLTHYPLANVGEVSLADYWVSNERLLGMRKALLDQRYLPICASCCSHVALMT